jgi:hypothetical protein
MSIDFNDLEGSAHLAEEKLTILYSLALNLRRARWKTIIHMGVDRDLTYKSKAASVTR